VTAAAEMVDELDVPREPIDPRTVRVRHSRLKEMGRSPLHYYHSVQDDRPDTLSLRLGRGAHGLAFGLPVVVWPGRRAGKAWEAFEAERTAAGCVILNEREHHEAQSVADALRRHRVASDLLFGGQVVHEHTIHWEWMGRACQSTPDALRPSALIDLKTTRSAEPGKFARDAMWMGYHAQLAFYRHGLAQAGLDVPPGTFIVAVESKAPHAVTVLRLTDRALLAGEKLIRLWFERLLQCEAANHWPAYTDAIEPFDVPDDDELRLTIGGEELEVA
jgi:hypothetical protein